MPERQLLSGALPLSPAGPTGGGEHLTTSLGYRARLRARLHARFWLKAAGTTAFMWLFFVGYFHLLSHPLRSAIEMPLTAVDRWVDFQAWALWPYISLWLYVTIPPSLLPTTRALLHYGIWIGTLCVAGLVCFYFWPTAVPRAALSTEGLPGFGLLRGIDAVGNACPSLHVAAATFSAVWIHRLARELMVPRWMQAGNMLWFVLIVWSTLATKQHVWWDVVAGLALALALAPLSLRSAALERRGDIIAADWMRPGNGQ